jgi:hypothetical protein
VKGKDELRVLYFFGGDDRRSDLRRALLDALALSGGEVDLCMEEVDLIQEPDLDVRDSEAQKHHAHNVVSGRWDVVLFSPPIGSFSRAAFASYTSTRPVRDAAWPDGFPWLEGAVADKVFRENEMWTFAFKILACASGSSRLQWWRRTRGWLEHPEDLGGHVLGDPASVWQLPKAREQLDKYVRSAFHQCYWDERGYAKPTACLSTIPEWNKTKGVHHGWPVLEANGMGRGCTGRVYKGPLPESCGHAVHSAAGVKQAYGTYGPLLCDAIAKAIVGDFLRRKRADIPTEGAESHGTIGLEVLTESASEVTGKVLEDKEVKEKALAAVSAIETPAAKGNAVKNGETVLLPSAAEIAEEASLRGATSKVEEPDTEADSDAEPAGAGWRGVGPKISVGSLRRKGI